MTKKILITGGCGFIGHHFVEHVYKNTDYQIYIIDKLSYAAKGIDRLRDFSEYPSDRITLFTCDLITPISKGIRDEMGDIDIIVHMAAESHVDNSVADPVPFVHNNVMSTVNMLEYARTLPNLTTFFYFSTDEVYGPALNGKLFSENERHKPTNPYSASKSCGEQLCMAYHNSYGLPVVRVNVMNAMGERQHVEKFIPKVIKNILTGTKTLIHAYPDKKTSGTRFYIHARNIAAGVMFLLEHGSVGEAYNITGRHEVSNLDLALFIANVMNKELDYELIDFHSSRPSHDLRYGLDGTKMAAMGWELPYGFEESLTKTVLWTLENQKWLEE